MRIDLSIVAALALAFFASTFSTQGQLDSSNHLDALQTNLPVLTQVDQIRRLSLTEAQRHYPVKLRGVVLDYSSLPTLFVCDQTGGIYVKLTAEQPLSQGEVVDIAGVSDAGRFAPMVVPSSLQVTGHDRLPPPRDVSFQQIATGVEDSQWVRIVGIVRSVATQTLKKKLIYPKLSLGTDDGRRLDVLVNDASTNSLQAFVDAEVAITGIAESIFNDKRQLINVRLLAPGVQSIEVKRAAPADVWAAPSHPIDSLRQFSPEEPSRHRVKVRGVVTWQKPGESLFIRDETASIRVETPQRDAVAPGDRIEVLGFPDVTDQAAVMQDATFHKVGASPPPPPVELTAKQAWQGNCDADLISVNAQLLDQFQTPDQLILVLQEDDLLFRAEMNRPQTPVRLRNGTQLRVTGICLAQFEKFRSPRGFQMLLRSSSDLTVLRQPSWWTTPRLRWALGILTGILLAVGIWVWALKQQVRVQTRAIADKIEREAVLQERMRIARELHDNLEQELAGVRMQLELTAATAARAPETAVANLQLARTMICHSQAEARRSVWELRSQVLENRTLPTALAAAVRNVENGAPIAVQVSGRPRALPMRTESNLLRIAQEALTNAIKHAAPRHISVQLAYEAGGARLTICDDGCGFAPASVPGAQDGHFGLLGMKERAGKIAGTLRVTSAPGRGTRVEIFVPAEENLE